MPSMTSPPGVPSLHLYSIVEECSPHQFYTTNWIRRGCRNLGLGLLALGFRKERRPKAQSPMPKAYRRPAIERIRETYCWVSRYGGMPLNFATAVSPALYAASASATSPLNPSRSDLSFWTPARMFDAGSYALRTRYSLAVAGMSCLSPIAPFDDRARGL